MEMYKKKKNRWSISKIELLIDLWAEHYRELKSCRRNDHVFVKMKHKLEKSGCKVTVEDIRIRINNLSAKYRKESMLTLSGGSPSRWPLFNKIHNILSNDTTLDETNETQEESMEVPDSRSKVYQLKCNYRQENIDNFFTDLYFNPRYADVTLVTCHEGETFAIPAHRMVLGNFSMYFANIFEKLNVPQNSNTYIVLPASVSHQTMQILMQYMYTGQSSVPEYNVDEVLRSGELLKIRGFWSENKTTPNIQQPSGAGQKRRAPGVEPRKVHNRQPGTSSSQDNSESSRPHAASRPALQTDLHSEVASDSGTSALDSLDEQKRLAIAAIQRDLHASSMRAMAHGAAALFSSSMSDVKQEPTEWDDLDDDNDSDEDVMILPEEAIKSNDTQDGKQQQPLQSMVVEKGPPQSHSSTQPPPTESSLVCDLCSLCFANTDELLQHIISSHGDPTEVLRKRSRLTEDENPLTNMRCDFCGKFFLSAVDWAQHVMQAHNDRTGELEQQMAQLAEADLLPSISKVRSIASTNTAE